MIARLLNSVPRLILAACILLCLLAGTARAQDESIIRDDEIESMLKSWIRPVIVADNLDPDSVHIIIVQSPQINSFVAGGPNIFLYTGLIMKADSAGEIVAVMSHELGHIAGGHLIRSRSHMEDASFEALLGSILGIGAAVLSHQGGAAAAIGGGAASMAQRNYLAFSRIQESSADQAAMAGMLKAHINPTGMVTFMEKLQSEEMLPETQQDAYVQTHPLTRDRIEALRDGVDRSPYKSAPYPPAWTDQFARLKAKLTGFINPGQVAWDYSDRDTSIPARYARAIAAYRQNDVSKALKIMDGLLASEPANPYFMELKGQMLVDFGRVKEAVPYYRKAVAAAPDAGLIRIAYAAALLESAGDNDHAQIKESINQLDRADRNEPRSILSQHLLATAYGRLGEEPVARLHLANESALSGNKKEAVEQAKAAMAGLKPGSPDWLQARDLLSTLDQGKNGKNDKG